jgi:MATE family multidrug resistance protein
VLSKEYIDQYKKNLILAIPIACSQLGHIAVGVADSIMVGKLGGTYLAAATIAFSVYVPFMMLGIGISYGISPLIAKADGEQNREEISSLLKHSIILNLFIGIFIALALILSSSILRNLDQPSEVVEMAIPFFQILAITTIPLMIFQTFRQFAEGLSITSQSMVISITGNIINIALNYILINGKLGFESYGVNGAGYATLTARIFMAVCMFLFVFYFPKFRVYWRTFSSIKFDVKVYYRMIKMSLPVGLQLSLEAGAFGFAAIMVGWVGSNELAAHHVALNMAAITYMAATGIGSASTVRVGNEFGKKDFNSVRKAGFSAFYIVIVFMSLSALGFVLFRHSLPQLYVNEPTIEHIAVSLLLISALFQVSDGIQVVGLGALRGIGDVRIPTVIALLAYWLIGLPVGYILAFSYGLRAEGVWYGLLIGLTVAAVFFLIRFNNKSKALLKEDTQSGILDWNHQ